MQETRDKSNEPTLYNPSKEEALNELNRMRPVTGCTVKVEPYASTAPAVLYRRTADGWIPIPDDAASDRSRITAVPRLPDWNN